MNRPLPNIDGMPIARLRDMQVTPSECEPESRDSLFNDIAYAIYITEVRAYRQVLLTSTDPNKIAMAEEAIRDAIVRALKANCGTPEPRFFDDDPCGNG